MADRSSSPMMGKFQASARELMKNLEEVMLAKKPDGSERDRSSSLENAFRAMFSSCTSGVTGNVVETDETQGDQATASSAPKTDERRKSRMNSNENTPAQQKEEDIGEHIYAQLFFDDQIRAAKAVSALRDQEEQQNKERGVFESTPQSVTPRVVSKPTTTVPKPFPVSSPIRERETPKTVSKESPKPPIATAELDIRENPTFDDNISAISAHTLEAMATSVGRSRSDLSNSKLVSRHAAAPQFPPIEEREEPRETLGAGRSPFLDANGAMYRSRSNQTADSKNSSPSKNSRTTSTTESSSFDVWHQEEKKYWADEARKDEQRMKSPPRLLKMKTPPRTPHRRKSRGMSSDSSRRTRSTDFSSTAGSAFSSTGRSPRRHPHDTFPYDVGGMFPEDEPVAIVPSPSRRRVVRDLGRIDQVMDISDQTEFSEI